MSATTRLRPAGPPAASVRPGSGGVGRSTSAAAERVSDDLRRGSGDFLEQRRWIAGLGTLAAGAVPLALAAKTAVDAAGSSVFLLAEQLTKHRSLCSWCTVAAPAQVATLPLALPEARVALHTLRRRR